MLIYSFLDAHHKACSPSNIKSGFEASGIYPLNPNRPLESQFTMPEIPANLKVRPEDETISGKWSNSEEMLRELFLLQHGRPKNPDDKSEAEEKASSFRSIAICKGQSISRKINIQIHRQHLMLKQKKMQ